MFRRVLRRARPGATLMSHVGRDTVAEGKAAMWSTGAVTAQCTCSTTTAAVSTGALHSAALPSTPVGSLTVHELRTSVAELLSNGTSEGVNTAWDLCTKTLAATIAARGETHIDVASALRAQAAVLTAAGGVNNCRTAGKLFDQAVEIMKASLGADHCEVAVVQLRKAMMLVDMGVPDVIPEALAILDQCLATLEKANHVEYADALQTKASALMAMSGPENLRAAITLLEQVLEVAKVKASRYETGRTLHMIAQANLRLKDHTAAIETYDRIITLLDDVTATASDRRKLPFTLYCQAIALEERAALGDRLRALERVDRAIAIISELDGDKHPDMARPLQLKASLLASAGQPEAAIALYDRCIAILDDPIDRPLLAKVLREKASVLSRLGGSDNIRAAAATLTRILQVPGLAPSTLEETPVRFRQIAGQMIVGDRREAASVVNRIIMLLESVEPLTPDTTRDVARALHARAVLLEEDDKVTALQGVSRAEQLYREIAHVNVASLLYTKGRLLLATKEHQAALRTFEHLILLCETAADKVPSSRLLPLALRGKMSAFTEIGGADNLRAAVDAFDQARAIEGSGPTGKRLADAQLLARIAMSYTTTRQWDAAITVFDRAIAVLDVPETSWEEKFELAIQLSQKAVTMSRTDAGAGSDPARDLLIQMLTLFDRAIELLRGAAPPTHPALAQTLFAKGNVLRKLGDVQAAVQAFDSCIAICEARQLRSEPGVQSLHADAVKAKARLTS
jgi:tetratricopeptide (TPR) repeat protein